MKKLNKNIILSLTLLIAFSIITAVTYSFYNDADEIENKTGMGITKGDIVEEFNGLEKTVKVQNTGTTKLLVRANAKMICTNGDIILDAGKIAAAKYNAPDSAIDDGNDIYWIDGKDGWYYYNKLLFPGEITEEFVHITTSTKNVPDDEIDLYDNSKLDVPVNMEYYLPLRVEGTNGQYEYTYEEAWNITKESLVYTVLQDILDAEYEEV